MKNYKAMENKIIKIDNRKEELTNVDELIAGCDSAVVTYGVDKEYNVYKVVTLFKRTSPYIYEFEDLGAAHTRVLATNPSMALLKQYDYRIQGKKLKKCCRDYVKVLVRTLLGFVKDSDTDDLRHKYEYKES